MPPQGNAAAGQAGQQQEGGGTSLMNRLLLGIAMYMGMNLLMSQFKKEPATTQVKDESGNLVTVPAKVDIPPYTLRPKTLDEGIVVSPIPHRIAPIWQSDSYVDIVITISDSFSPKPIASTPPEFKVLEESRFKLGNFSEKRFIDTTFRVPKAVQNNATLWGHFYIGLSGSQLDPGQQGWNPATAYHVVHPLTQYLPKKKTFKTRNLLDDMPQAVDEVEEDVVTKGPVIANYYHPNATLSFVSGLGVVDFPKSHPALRHFLQLETTGARDATGKNSWYYPVLFVNTFWQLRTHMQLLNETVTELPLHIDLGNLRSWQFHAMAAVELSSKEAARQAAFGASLPGGGDGTEIEIIKEVLLDSNPYLLGVTVVVSIAHIILEMLAFGSDIAHYRKKKDNVGISVRSILANVFMQTVILLYLVDNSQNTSWMILGSQAVGIVIELWKITTVVNVRVRPAGPEAWFPYKIQFEDQHQLSETEEKTKEYDEIAFKYMYWGGVPLLLAYAVYALVYQSHKSWYSYIITTLVGSVYAYGFLLMVPALYINYRLKSVAHMPAKAMMYKFLNTFIDDLFAFTIKMPLLHRLATLRDDVIFFIYIYQRWAYKVDYSRVNEFGQGGDETEDKPAAKQVEGTGAAAKVGETEAKALPDTAAAAVVDSGASTTGASTGQAAKKRK